MRFDGPSTFIAAGPIGRFTLVRVKPGSSSLPAEIEAVPYTFPGIGICESGARVAGEPVTVIPLNYEQFQRVTCTAVFDIEVGQTLYVTSVGTVTDVYTGGSSAGVSLNAIPAGTTTLALLGATGSGGFNRAEDIAINPPIANYGTTEPNVEAYLGTAADFIAPKTVTKHVYAQELLIGNSPLPTALNAGRLSSGIDPLIYAGSVSIGSSSIWSAVYDATATGPNSVFMSTIVEKPDSVIVSPAHAMTIDLLRRFQSSESNTISGTLTFSFPSGDDPIVHPFTLSPSSAVYGPARILGISDAVSTDARFENNDVYSITINLQSVQLDVPLYMRGLIFTFTGKIYPTS